MFGMSGNRSKPLSEIRYKAMKQPTIEVAEVKIFISC